MAGTVDQGVDTLGNYPPKSDGLTPALDASPTPHLTCTDARRPG